MDKIISYNPVTDRIHPNVDVAKLRAMYKSLDMNNTFMPNIERVIYNLGKKAYPKRDENGHKIKDENGKLVMAKPIDVLTTVVFFKDHTKVIVTNSEHDGIELTEVAVNKTDKNAPKVKVATERSKEIGLMYAIAKRMIGRPDDKGTITPNGFINKIQSVVKNATDSKLDGATRAYNDKLAKEAAKQKAAEPKADKPKNASLAQVVNDLGEVTKNLLSVTKDLANK